jgi:CBS domain-containing protein
MSLDQFRLPVVTASMEDTVETAARRMRDHRVGCLIVTREGRPIGIVTDRDLVNRVLAEGCDPTSARLHDFVTFDPLTVSVQDSTEYAAARMREHGVRRLPVVDDNGKVVGIVTSDDLLVVLGQQLGAVCQGIENRCDSNESR